MSDNLPIIFNFETVNDELIQPFLEFFPKYDLMPLFNHEEKTTSITVSDSDLRSVLNDVKVRKREYVDRTVREVYSGKYASTLFDFANFLHMNQDNQKFNEAVFRILEESSTFTQMMKHIRKIMNVFTNEIYQKHQFNKWNIVWYHKEFNH